MCEHLDQLHDSYPGCFCIYCGEPVAVIEADEYGQLYHQRIERDKPRRYVAVIHKDQQRAVASLTLDTGRVSLLFKGDNEPTKLEASLLLSAFQDGETESEVLRIK